MLATYEGSSCYVCVAIIIQYIDYMLIAAHAVANFIWRYVINHTACIILVHVFG